jgi:acyl-CoA synthetase (NDP forming)
MGSPQDLIEKIDRLFHFNSGDSSLPHRAKGQGSVGIISHSASLTNTLGRLAESRGIFFSKVVTLGGDSDLNCEDFLQYLGQDPDTGLIGCYLERIEGGSTFLGALRDASLKKPVILWTAGLGREGPQAAAPQTGMTVGSIEIWNSLVRQGGGIPVMGFEAWFDSLMGFSLLSDHLGVRIAIISGPGGLAVATAEACGQEGLPLAELSLETKSSLAEFVPHTGTSLRNPIDVGLTAAFDVEIYVRAARFVAADPGVDAIMVVGRGLSPQTNRAYTESMIQAQHASQKPFLMIKIPGFDPKLAQRFCKEGLPFFDSAERAARTYAGILRYQRWRQNRT